MTAATTTLSNTSFSDLELLHRGKVRDVYQLDSERLLLVTTDRLSAFDCILPTPIERKGEILTALSNFWFKRLETISDNHLLVTDFDSMPEEVVRHPELRGRTVVVNKTSVYPVECVVRGYLEGSGWKDYLATGSVCGHELPPGLKQCGRLPEPLFTPATKAAQGHDENISEEQMSAIVGTDTAEKLKKLSLEIYNEASAYALERGIIIADTKLEFGLDEDGQILLIDEVLTPDSSRFWTVDKYEPGHAQQSFDKQFVREYLETLDWDKQPPAPPLPEDVAAATTERYLEAYRRLSGKEL